MLNNVILMGRLVAEPELRTTASGVSVCSFTVAVERSYVKQGEERQADFIDCVAWRQSAEFLTRYFAKGQLVALEGSLQKNMAIDITELQVYKFCKHLIVELTVIQLMVNTTIGMKHLMNLVVNKEL